jgi:hypothetical protein
MGACRPPFVLTALSSPANGTVLSVTRISANQADWLFDIPTTTSGINNQCKIAGNGPGVSAQQGPNTIRSTYSLVNSGAAWTITATEPNLTPSPLFPQSGTVI